MTEHLPECPQGYAVPFTLDRCICDELRTCEERIKTHEGCADAERIEGYLDGYAAALVDAEEAIRAALSKDERNLYPELLALHAIWELKEKS